MDLGITLFYQPIFNILIVLYRTLGNNLGIAIILVALISRFISLPVIIRQRKMTTQSADLNKQIKEIKDKYKNDKEKANREVVALQSQFLPGQLAGCLPMILQFIVFINIYNVIINLFTKGAEAFNLVAYSFVPKFEEGAAINYNFLGFELNKHPSEFISNVWIFLPYLILMILISLTQYYSTKMALNAANPLVSNNENEELRIKEAKAEKRKAKSEKDELSPEDMGAIAQRSMKQTMLLFPAFYFLLSYNFPAGSIIYWIVQNCFVIIQQLVIKRMSKPKLILEGETYENKRTK